MVAYGGIISNILYGLSMKETTKRPIKEGRTSQYVSKEKIQNKYDSMEMVSWAGELGGEEYTKPSFDKIDRDVQLFDDGAIIVTLGSQDKWIELEPKKGI